MQRRQHLKLLVGAAALAGAPLARPQAAGAIPQQGIANRFRHLSYSDQGGKPDGVQVMYAPKTKNLFVGHMFSDGLTILDASDPRNLKPLHFFTAGQGTRTHQMQTHEDIMLLANGANIVAMQSYDGLRGYFENNLADSITNRRTKFRSGMSIHDISRSGQMREIAFLEMPGLGVNRIGWQGGRYAYVAAHFDGFTDHILCVVDLQDITRPQLVSRWWLPGMNRAAGETPKNPQGKRWALHHLIPKGNIGLGAWRDGGMTVHDLSDPANPKLLSQVNWSPPFPGGTHTPLYLPGRKLAVVADEANAQKCAKGTFHTFVLDMRAPDHPVPISTLPTPRDRDWCASPGTFGPHNLHENRPGSFQSEDVIFSTYNNAGVRVYDIRDQFAPKEIASWIPPLPGRLIDPRPNIALDAKTADIWVTPEGLTFVSDWNAGLHVLEYTG